MLSKWERLKMVSNTYYAGTKFWVWVSISTSCFAHSSTQVHFFICGAWWGICKRTWFSTNIYENRKTRKMKITLRNGSNWLRILYFLILNSIHIYNIFYRYILYNIIVIRLRIFIQNIFENKIKDIENLFTYTFTYLENTALWIFFISFCIICIPIS